MKKRNTSMKLPSSPALDKYLIRRIASSTPDASRYGAGVKVLSEYIDDDAKEEYAQRHRRVNEAGLSVKKIGRQLADRKALMTTTGR